MTEIFRFMQILQLPNVSLVFDKRSSLLHCRTVNDEGKKKTVFQHRQLDNKLSRNSFQNQLTNQNFPFFLNPTLLPQTAATFPGLGSFPTLQNPLQPNLNSFLDLSRQNEIYLQNNYFQMLQAAAQDVLVTDYIYRLNLLKAVEQLSLEQLLISRMVQANAANAANVPITPTPLLPSIPLPNLNFPNDLNVLPFSYLIPDYPKPVLVNPVADSLLLRLLIQNYFGLL